jgi:hypothetical protein
MEDGVIFQVLQFIRRRGITKKFHKSSHVTFHLWNSSKFINVNWGRAIAQAVSRWLPTATARVQTRV